MIGRSFTWSLCALLLGARCGVAAINFVNPSGSTPVPLPAFLASADFNRDGRADVALSSTQSNRVSILLGSASGTLISNITYDFGKQLGGLDAADINADGLTDIAVADTRGPGVYVLLGVGNGTFAPAVLVPVGRTPVAVAIVDLDDKNGADLIVADRAENRILVLLNGGSTPASFTAAGEVAVGQGPDSVILADFNGDGRSDVATLNTANRVKTVSIVLFDGIVDGLPTFDLVASFAGSESPSGLRAANFAPDASIDVAMLNSPGGGINGSVDVLLGQGTGLLVDGPSLAVPCPVFTGDLTCRVRAFASADFDADGTLDLAVTQTDPRTASAGDWLAIFRGIGDGSYEPGPVFATATLPTLIVVADVTGDGSPDLVVASERDRTLEAFVNTSTGSTADRLPGQACEADTQCTTGLCRDTVCCRTECRAGERCNHPSDLGSCTPEGEERPRGSRCESGDQCQSGFCVDQVCCIAGTCPTGARCDIPATAGLCAAPAASGQSCERTQHCASGLCIDSFCCNEECPEGRCDAPGREGTCTGSLPDGEPCSANAQCATGICDTAATVCCALRCSETQHCSMTGTICVQNDTPTPTATASPSPSTTPTRIALCVGDCDDNRNVAVSELVTGVNIALGRAGIEICSVFDTSGDGIVAVNELVAAVASALRGCAAP